MSMGANEIKQARGHIVVNLRAFYPNGMSGGLIFRESLAPVFPNMEWSQAVREISYLLERGYVEHVGDAGLRKAESARERVYRLTSSGYDLASGVVEDDAIAMMI